MNYDPVQGAPIGSEGQCMKDGSTFTVIGAPGEKEKPELKPLLKRQVGYEIYEHEKLTNFRLNRVERKIVEVYSATFSGAECLRAVCEMLGRTVSRTYVDHKLKRAHVKACITEVLAQRATSDGLTRERWESLGVKGMLGERRINGFFWQQLGKYKGWIEEKGDGGSVNIQNVIKFTQADGKE